MYTIALDIQATRLDRRALMRVVDGRMGFERLDRCRVSAQGGLPSYCNSVVHTGIGPPSRPRAISLPAWSMDSKDHLENLYWKLMQLCEHGQDA